MTKSRLNYSAFLILVSMWWGWTILVDIFIVPVVFRHVDDFFKAGEFATSIFAQINILEIIVSSMLVGLMSFVTVKGRRMLPLFFITIVVFGISLTYFSYLTPKILELTGLWKQADLMGLVGIAGISDIQQEHHFFHNLYIILDVVKLLLLTIMLTFGITTKQNWA